MAIFCSFLHTKMLFIYLCLWWTKSVTRLWSFFMRSVFIGQCDDWLALRDFHCSISPSIGGIERPSPFQPRTSSVFLATELNGTWKKVGLWGKEDTGRGLQGGPTEINPGKWSIFLCCLIFLVSHISNIIWNTSISGVKSGWTSLYSWFFSFGLQLALVWVLAYFLQIV